MATTTSALAPEVSPEEVGFDPVRLERLERHLERYVAERRRIGTLTVITRGGKIAYVGSTGHRDEAASLPVETDTIWRIYSMTKPFTSVAALMLHEEGLLSLSDPVAKFIPSFGDARVYRAGPAAAPLTAPASEQMLVRHLLTHTAGLTYGFYFRDQVDEAYRQAGFMLGWPEEYSLAEACDGWASIPLLFEPGSEWNYSVATDVLGRVIEVVSGQSLDEFFARRIFEPLRLSDTGFSIDEADRPRLAALYGANPETGKAEPAEASDQVKTERPQFLAGGHGLVSTAADYHRFTQLLLRGGELEGVRLLSSRTIGLMAQNHTPGGGDIPSSSRPSLLGPSFVGRGFGLGLSPLIDPVGANSLSSVGEFGWGGAAGTEFWVDPAEELTVLFFTQVLFAADDLRAELRRLVYQALVG